MNAWHEGVSYAARDRIQRYRAEARRSRLARADAEVRPVGVALWRRRAAAALRGLADALAPQTEPAAHGAMPRGLETGGGRPLG